MGSGHPFSYKEINPKHFTATLLVTVTVRTTMLLG